MKNSLLPQWLQARDGKMTRELLLRPSDHGLGMTHDSLRPETTTTATCGYCSTGCGLRLHLREGQAIGLTPETNYPVNLGMACPKGWDALRVLDSDDRATVPRIRQSDGEYRDASWDEALKFFCSQFKRTQAMYGPDSVAFISTGQIASEEMALLGALAKFGMGFLHGDGNTRQCMATAVSAYKESFGFDAPPFTYDDFEKSDVLVFIGANPCVAHPIMWERVLRNPYDPDMIVIDPRCTETAMAAGEHLQLRPKSDLSLLYAITHEVIARGHVDEIFVREHTEGFEQLQDHLVDFSPNQVAAICGISADRITQVADRIGQGMAVSFWWTMGVNQSYEGTRVAQAIINLALLTGNIGRPGTGANSITGQCNAMGSRLWSNTTNLIGGHKFELAEDRKKIASILSIPIENIPTITGWSYDRIMDGIRQGKVKALWVIATNPAHSWIDQAEARKILDSLDFLVVQDMYVSTETAQRADLILPAAAWGEKDGTFINSERRYGLLKKVRKAPGQALSDFSIFKAIAHYWGIDELFAQWTDPEAVFRIMQELSRGMPHDITGIDGYQQIDRCGGIQWPWTQTDAASNPDPDQQRRLFASGVFPHTNGRAKLIVDDVTPPPETPCGEYPIWLLSGRGTVSQWHTQTRTGKSPILRKLYPNQPYVEIHPEDARKIGVVNGQEVVVRSRRGEAIANAMIVPTVAVGQAFMPMHYEATNQLTLSHFDPHSRQPSYKDCAVKIEPTQIKRK